MQKKQRSSFLLVNASLGAPFARCCRIGRHPPIFRVNFKTAPGSFLNQHTSRSIDPNWAIVESSMLVKQLGASSVIAKDLESARDRKILMREKSTCTVLILCLLLGGLTAGCKKKVVAAAPPAPAPAPEVSAPPPPKAPTASLIAEPTTIERGQSATLRWSSTDAADLTISGLGAVEGQGNRDVRPAESTVYRLTATGPGGSVTATATVNVTVPTPVALSPLPPLATLEQRIAMELSDAFFDYDSNTIREDAQAVLAKNANALRSILADFAEAVIYLEGHCDERGSAEYNLGLGDRRAVSVSAYLQAMGVPADRLVTVSIGKERPQCTESTEACWQKNRRVHFSANKPASPEVSVVSSNNE
jgi:peptidoglycan-associated lipoprotein